MERTYSWYWLLKSKINILETEKTGGREGENRKKERWVLSWWRHLTMTCDHQCLLWINHKGSTWRAGVNIGASFTSEAWRGLSKAAVNKTVPPHHHADCVRTDLLLITPPGWLPPVIFCLPTPSFPYSYTLPTPWTPTATTLVPPFWKGDYLFCSFWEQN